ncbi:MAG: hypothetical protein EBT27_09540 [Betaproteobacteria bacterium]|nr:hypothetical protein [Betaproteobacteria bacterium]
MPRGVSRIDEALLQRRLWTPAASRPRLWLDAADLSTITTVSGNVSEWRDKSGNANHAVPSSASLRPSLVLSDFQARPCIRFVRNDDLTTLNSIGIGGNQNRGMFVVSRRRSVTANAANEGLMAFWGTPSNNPTGGRGFGIDIQSTTQYWYYWYDDITSTSYAAADLIHIWGLTHTNGVGEAYATDNFVANRNVTANTTDTPVQIGWRGGAGAQFGYQYSDVDIAEIVIVGETVDRKTRYAINGYAAWKWGLVSSLPASHPFKNRPPVIGD